MPSPSAKLDLSSCEASEVPPWAVPPVASLAYCRMPRGVRKKRQYNRRTKVATKVAEDVASTSTSSEDSTSSRSVKSEPVALLDRGVKRPRPRCEGCDLAAAGEGRFLILFVKHWLEQHLDALHCRNYVPLSSRSLLLSVLMPMQMSFSQQLAPWHNAMCR